MRSLLTLALSAPFLITVACSSEPAATTSGSGGGGGASEPPPTGELPEHPRELPFDYARPDTGAPLTEAEVTTATQQYLEILKGTRWFDAIAERAHGWPETDPKHGYWYATWWSGVSAERAGAKVTFRHSKGGADNNGLRTAQLLEGACYGATLWAKPEMERLTRRLARGSTSWFLAMERQPEDSSFLMARAAYPAPVESTETPLPLFIDYAPARPGEDDTAAYYVHLPDNPSWPDLWVRNMRSKDDIGHLLRALGEIDTCNGRFTDPEAQKDLVELRRRFEGFSRRVEDEGYAIATLDRTLNEYVPEDGLAHFITFLECNALMTIQLTGRGEPRDLDCGDGNDPVPEGVESIKSSSMQIIRSFHAAAVQQALIHGRTDVAEAMVAGIGKRLDKVMDLIDGGAAPSNFSTKDLAAFLVHAANAGVPLTSREVRYLHARIAEAHASYLDPTRLSDYDLFSASAPDGDYPYEPGGEGIDWKDLGVVLGLCAAQYRNPTSRPAIDCDAVKASAP